MTNEQMIFIGTLLTILATYLTNRASGLNQTINTLSETIVTLRGEINAERTARQDAEEEYQKKLREMSNKFEDERNRYRRYITQLIKQLNDNKIVPYEWDVD